MTEATAMQWRIPNVMNVCGNTIQLPTLAASAQPAMIPTRFQKCDGGAPLAVGQHQADSDEQQERGHDQRAKGEPERIVLEIGGDDAVEAQVEREVIDEHQA